MKRFLLTITFTFTIMLAVIASIFVCDERADAESVAPWNVQFTVEHGSNVYRYNLANEIVGLEREADSRGFYLGSKAKRQLCSKLLSMQVDELAAYDYLLPNFSKVVQRFNYVNRDKKDAAVYFNKQGFSYHEGCDGVQINIQQLFDLALNSNGKNVRFALPLTIDKALTVHELRQNTVLKSTFSTQYANSGENRCYNIAKAADAIDGTTVGVGETFSFNTTVGDRTLERGYRMSKVILDGNYTEGVGGGVCQVSTTLYNALLLAGIIPRAVQHSLVSSYVKAGFDAMVSYGSADLTFTNNTNHPIYIAAITQGKSVTFTIYGEPNEYRIERESVEQRDKFTTTYVVDTEKYPELIYTDQTKVVTSGSDGVKTKSYLKYYQGNKLVATKLIRTNSYKRVDQVIARGAQQRPSEDMELA